MIKRYNNLSFLFFVPGIIAQIVGLVMTGPEREVVDPIAIGVILVGTLMVLIGFAYYARAKGRSALWALFGFMGLPGLLVLAILKDRSSDSWNT